jgi:hypothetical protein
LIVWRWIGSSRAVDPSLTSDPEAVQEVPPAGRDAAPLIASPGRPSGPSGPSGTSGTSGPGPAAGSGGQTTLGATARAPAPEPTRAAIAGLREGAGSAAADQHRQVLVRIGPAAIPHIMDEVRRSTSKRWHSTAIQTLRDIGPAAVRSLSTNLTDPDESVRLIAAMALFDLGPQDRLAWQSLSGSRSDPNTRVAYLAEMARRRLTGTLFEQTPPPGDPAAEHTVPPLPERRR